MNSFNEQLYITCCLVPIALSSQRTIFLRHHVNIRVQEVFFTAKSAHTVALIFVPGELSQTTGYPVYRTVYLFTPQLLLVLSIPTRDGQAELT